MRCGRFEAASPRVSGSMRWCKPACPDLFPGPDELTLASSTDRCNIPRTSQAAPDDQGYEFATSGHRDLKGQGRAWPRYRFWREAVIRRSVGVQYIGLRLMGRQLDPA